mmetsp:Transcript_33946/g.25026  ORF Transcript_33946/g.25026 Transcript_33946/m.25026 type:complete len:131 (-) Transcript_33946:451-843(-)
MYASQDSYPLGSETVTWQGQNSTVAVFGSSSYYNIESTYYLRIVPKFALYDTLTNKQFIVDSYGFSVHPEGTFADLYLFEPQLGFANNSHAYYRHYLGFPNSTYTITVISMEGQPTLLVGINSAQEMYPT